MKHIVKFSLTLLSVSVLAACGGGGSNGGTSSHNSNNTAKHIQDAQLSSDQISAKVDFHLNEAKKISSLTEETLKQTTLAQNIVVAARDNTVAEAKNVVQNSASAMDVFSNPMKDRKTVDAGEMAKANAIEALAKANSAVAEINKQVAIAEEAALVTEQRAEHVNQALVELQKADQLSQEAFRRAERLVTAAEENLISAENEERRLLEQIGQSENLLNQGLDKTQQLLLQSRYQSAYKAAKEQAEQARKQAEKLKVEAEKVRYQAEDIQAKVRSARGISDKMSHDATSAKALAEEVKILQETADKALNTAKNAVDKMKSINFVPFELRETVREAKKILVGDHKISLADEYYGYVEKNIENARLKVYNLAYSGVGYVLDSNTQTDAYGQLSKGIIDRQDIGENTASLPNADIFTYNGQSFGAKTDGVLTLKADFGSKTVSGQVTDRRLIDTKQQLSNIILQETAIDSQGKTHFSGVASYQTDRNVVGSYEGNFKGPKAQEVVGYINDGNGNFYEGFAGRAEINDSLLGNK